MPLYEYICDPCTTDSRTLEDFLEPGRITLFRPVAFRDKIVICPGCASEMQRQTSPHGFVTYWIGKTSRYPILEGPSVNVYKRGEERKKKEARQKSKTQFAPLSHEKAALLKEDSLRAPKVSEAPPSGVSVQNKEH
jgi:predicted nucleic acid-binding Zn ribbon protein